MEEMLKQILSKLDKLDRIESELAVVKSNQLTFLQELREMRLENQTRDRVVQGELNKHDYRIDVLNRRLFDLESEVTEIKRS